MVDKVSIDVRQASAYLSLSYLMIYVLLARFSNNERKNKFFPDLSIDSRTHVGHNAPREILLALGN
jgi:hypothetical protein